MGKKIGFVIMGYGKKLDGSTGRMLDLDFAYNNIIKPVLEECGVCSKRGDEIAGPSIIDRGMYSLLLRADIVIAEISTYNPNALYELGVRHALKPKSTIIMRDGKGSIPFDISHNRLILYEHEGETICDKEVEKCKATLKKFVEAALTVQENDSPVYEFLSSLTPPGFSGQDLDDYVSDLVGKKSDFYIQKTTALAHEKIGNFEDAVKIWEKLNEERKDDPELITRLAFSIYKNGKPDKKIASENALSLLGGLPNNTHDPEILGIAGSINKKLFEYTQDVAFLQKAYKYYNKGFVLNDNNFYVGENVSNCALLLSAFYAKKAKTWAMSTFYKSFSKQNIQEVSNLVEVYKKNIPSQNPENDLWLYATAARCHLELRNFHEYKINEQLFFSKTTADWQKTTYQDNISLVKKVHHIWR